MAKILVVEDDELFRVAICDLLKKKGHTVFEAAHGRAAVEIISLQDFELVISDIQMPGMNGIDLLEWSIKNKPIPFIVMTGFSTILETQTAYDLGAKEFINKPFQNADLMEMINKILGIQGKLPVVSGPTDFCKVSLDEFVSARKVEFDIYVKLSSEKYVKIAHKGEDLAKERIIHYKNKGVKYLYISKGDFNTLIGFNLVIAEKIQGNKSISFEKKVNFLKYTGEVILTKAFIDGVDKEVFFDAKTFVELTINALTDTPECLDLLSLFNSHSNHVYAHSVGVAIYSFMIAQKMGYQSNRAHFILSMAGMFHDIGKKEIDLEILEKHRTLLSADEKKMLDSHVSKGQEIMLSIKGIPEEVGQLVFEHHEDAIGLGYPMGKTKIHQHALSPIIQLANQFVNLALKNPHHPGMNAQEAIKYIEMTFAGRYSEKVMVGLKSCLEK